MNNQKYPKDLIPTRDAARLLGITENTLQMRRLHGLPPRYYKLGPGKHSHVRYSKGDVLDYLGQCLHEPEPAGVRGVRHGKK
jgi:hypothetical protein